MRKRLGAKLISLILIVTSCSTLQKGYIKFDPPGDELITTQQIKEFMKVHPNPSIVIIPKINQTQTNLTNQNGYLYNAVEKELSLAGFMVLDRGLLVDVVNRATTKDYGTIEQFHDVDLVLEVIQAENNRKYVTDRVWRKNGKEKILYDYYSVTKYGAIIEYRILIVNTNEYGGSYLFNYTPCPPENNDCNCIIAFKDVPDRTYPTINFCGKKSKSVFDFVDRTTMESLARSGIKKMIDEIRK